MAAKSSRLPNIPDSAWRVGAARAKLLGWAKYVDPAYVWPRHLRLLADKLEAVERGEIPRLIVEMPPRHGKSETSTIKFPAWYLGRNPDKRVIVAAYGAELAYTFSRRARNDFTAFAPEVWGLQVSDDSAAVDRWEIKGRRGGMVAAGVGGPITGQGADLLLIDDPVKDAEAANSSAQREAVWDWYTSVARTRLHPGGAIVLIMTRWHKDDLAGRLLAEAEQGGEPWEVLRLPAVADEADALGRQPGEALWPERYPLDELNKIRAAVGSYVWSALYQQSPVDREGGMFRREWFEIVEQAPADLRKARYWDLAATEPKKGSDPDWTAGALVGEKDGVYYILDIRRARTTPMGVEALVRQTAELDGQGVPIYMEQEPGSSGVNTIDHYARMVLKGYAFRGIKSTGPKELRAQPVSAAAEAGNVKLLKGTWNRDFLDEIEVFPNGAHDDQCLVAGTLVETTAGSIPIEDVKPGMFVWTRNGPRRVFAAGLTSIAKVFRVALSDGRELIGTANHPVFVIGRGFTPIGDLREGDFVEIWRGRRSSLTASSFTDTPTHPADTYAFTTGRTHSGSSRLYRYIERYGNTIMARCLKGQSFITKTVIPSTTTSRTSSALHGAITSERMVSEDNLGSRNIWRESDRWRQSGTNQPRGESGIRNTPEASGGQPGNWFVLSAAEPSKPTTQAGACITVQKLATNAIDCELGTRSIHASAAGRCTDPLAGTRSSARVSVMRVIEWGTAPVFNLRVDGDAEYYANGVLVHNCDALSGAFEQLSKPRFFLV